MKNVFSLFMILFCAVVTMAQNRQQGSYIEFGRTIIDATSLNTSLKISQLAPLENENFYYKIGFEKRYNKFRLGFGTEGITQSQENNDFSTSVFTSGLAVKGGYAGFSKKNISLIPQIGLGFGSTILNIAENPLPSATKFGQAISLMSINNTLTTAQLTGEVALGLEYLLKRTDKIVEQKEGRVVKKSYLRLGFVVGYRPAMQLGGWTQGNSKISDAPNFNTSGFFFGFRTGNIGYYEASCK